MVNVVGLGYIGLPTILMLGAHGVEVTGTDYNSELVETLNPPLCLSSSGLCTPTYPCKLLLIYCKSLSLCSKFHFLSRRLSGQIIVVVSLI